jgi:hypothetical protein
MPRRCPAAGRKLKSFFTISAAARYGADMLLWFIAAAAAAASALPASAQSSAGPTGAVLQARATVRIVSGARVKLGPQQTSNLQSSDVPPQRDTIVVADGSRRPAKLIEFE